MKLDYALSDYLKSKSDNDKVFKRGGNKIDCTKFRKED